MLILLLLAVAGAAAALVWMHLTVQGQRGPLPTAGELMDLSKESDLPIKVSVIETAIRVNRPSAADPFQHPQEREVRSVSWRHWASRPRCPPCSIEARTKACQPIACVHTPSKPPPVIGTGTEARMWAFLSTHSDPHVTARLP